MYDRQKIEETCNYYCGDNMKRLKRICHKKIRTLASLSKIDYDEFLSKANETVFLAAKAFDETKNDNFEGFLVYCINKKFISENIKYNRKKRIPQNAIVYLDKTIGSGKATVGDILPSDFDLFNEAFGNTYEEPVEFLARFPAEQKIIANFICSGYSNNEIKEILSMSSEHFNKNLAEIRELILN